MTTVVAVETADGVVIASDSRMGGAAINDGWVSKVFQKNGMTFGVAGYLRVLQALQHSNIPEPPKSTKQDKVERWLTTELAPHWMQIIADFADASGAKRGSNLLLVIHGKVYEIVSSGAWTRSVSGFYVIGSGFPYAIGALEAGASAKQAVKIASRYDGGTNADVKKLVIKAS